MKKVELEIVILTKSATHSESYTVVLGDLKGTKRLPIVIGSFEAQSIAVAIEKMTPSRPLTHDLMKNFCETYGIELQEVIISNLTDGIFYSKLICVKDGETIEIDSRTSDALALAVRFDCPINTYDFILDSAGITLEDTETKEEQVEVKSEKKSPRPQTEDITQVPIEQLKEMLKDVLAKEDYEAAARIRDELNKREPEG